MGRGRVDYPGVPVQTWGERLASARTELAYSQRDLAQGAGVTQQTISKIEAGALCPHDTLKARLAAALQMPVGSLFPWPEDPPKLDG